MVAEAEGAPDLGNREGANAETGHSGMWPAAADGAGSGCEGAGGGGGAPLGGPSLVAWAAGLVGAAGAPQFEQKSPLASWPQRGQIMA